MDLTTSIRNSQSPGSDRGGDRPADAADRSFASLVDRVGALVAERLWPSACAVDRADHLPADHFEAFADLGLYGMAVPPERGGLGLRPPEVRRVLRLLGSGCGASAFAFAQHHGTVGSLVATENRALGDRWLPRLTRDRLAGIAYAHVRRRGIPVLTAGPSPSGWVLDGEAPWVTSWGAAAAFAVAANTTDGRLVWALVAGRQQPGLTVAKRFDLMVFGATQTVALRFDRFAIDEAAVLQVIDVDRWAGRDRLMAARPNPLCLGVGDRAIELLAGAAPPLASALRPWWDDVAARAESQSVAVDRGEADLAQVAAARAEVLLAVQRLTLALLAATGGAAMERTNPAQLLSREALFYVIQAQSDDGRRATLNALGRIDS